MENLRMGGLPESHEKNTKTIYFVFVRRRAVYHDRINLSGA